MPSSSVPILRRMTRLPAIGVLAMALGAATIAGTGCDDRANMEKSLRAKKKAERTQKAKSKSTRQETAKARSRIARMPPPSKLLEQARKHFSPLPAFAPAHPNNPMSPQKIELGKKLFADASLSAPGDRSCASCHPLDNNGAAIPDLPPIGEPTSSPRRAPSIFNKALAISLYWDGRARDLEEQATMALFNSDELGLQNEAQLIEKLKADPDYSALFAAAFPDEPINAITVGRALASFERQLLSPGPFDHFLRGDVSALDDGELYGLHLFMKFGCANCHAGPLLGDTMYQRLGMRKPWNTPDLGRYGVTRIEQDRYMFKVASLRNVADTGPYLHDGSIANLGKMVNLMIEHQTRSTVEAGDIEALTAFLKALKGQLPAGLVPKPVDPYGLPAQ